MMLLNDLPSMARALARDLEMRLWTLLAERVAFLVTPERDLSGAVQFLIVQPGDTAEDVRSAVGFSPLDGRGLVGLARHDGLYEMTFASDGRRRASVLLVQNQRGVAPDLIALCRDLAVGGAAEGYCVEPAACPRSRRLP